ncbi:serine hydrolase domain-containing protein [Chryseobacterium gleum]|uniref:serine hydrolase domain-containing protein n=1 Tax=Chryseobacterium gleum TaxID=250 RepID=UPI001E379335|nr:serine hydrolase domain-containing protein [Chryseobacterium gleum]MCD9616867.1 beta-lactamase family protein [Chryseobacterium gleum]
MKNILFIVSMLFFTIVPFSGQNHKKEVLEYLAKEMKKEKIPGLQIAVVKNRKILFSESLGIANVEFSAPVTNNTIFSINSIAKIFTAVAIMQLVEKNNLEIEKPISVYLDDVPENWGRITTRQLLSHTSGLPDIESENGDGLISDKGQDSAWVKVQALPILSDPGEKFNYNATNYLVLQKIIEKMVELPFEEWVEKSQFRIAKMNNTKYGNSYDVMKNKAPTYSFYTLDKATGKHIKGNKLRELYEDFPTSFRADAGVFTSASDIAQWIIALQDGKFLQHQENVKKMWTPVPLNNGTYEGFGTLLNAYALGWPVIRRDAHFAVSALGGGRASVNIYPDDNLAVILLTNLTGVETYTIADNISKMFFKK